MAGGLPDFGTPEIVPVRAGCAPKCNKCGRVCPTGAIRSLPLDIKRRTSIGTAKHIDTICLPRSETENCTVCHDTCREVGRNAIHFEDRMVYYRNPEDEWDEISMLFEIPVVDPERCVGCGMCVTACNRANVRQRKVLPEPAIKVKPRKVQVLQKV